MKHWELKINRIIGQLNMQSEKKKQVLRRGKIFSSIFHIALGSLLFGLQVTSSCSNPLNIQTISIKQKCEIKPRLRSYQVGSFFFVQVNAHPRL